MNEEKRYRKTQSRIEKLPVILDEEQVSGVARAVPGKMVRVNVFIAKEGDEHNPIERWQRSTYQLIVQDGVSDVNCRAMAENMARSQYGKEGDIKYIVSHICFEKKLEPSEKKEEGTKMKESTEVDFKEREQNEVVSDFKPEEDEEIVKINAEVEGLVDIYNILRKFDHRTVKRILEWCNSMFDGG